MDFNISTEDAIAIESLRRCIMREVLPMIDGKRDDGFSSDVAHDLLTKLSEFGIGSGWVGEDEGGLGLSHVTSGLLYEELAIHAPEVAGLAYVSEGAAAKIYKLGSSDQKSEYLPGLLRGRLIGCGGVTEPSTGSNVRQMRTKAIKVDGGWRITGEKMFISNADIADFIILLARTENEDFTLFIIDRRIHEFETRGISKLGLHGWSFASVSMQDMYVDDSCVLGSVGKGLREAMTGFERARAWISVIASGICQAALRDAISYSKDREQFGNPIASFQLVQGLLADMACETEASRLLTHRALFALDQSGRCDLETSIAKVFSAETCIKVASRAIQVHGAYGLTTEFPVERHFRNARVLTIPDGTSQINQLIIGRELTGYSAFVAGKSSSLRAK